METVQVSFRKSRTTGDIATAHLECEHCGREWDVEILPFLDFDDIVEMIEENIADHSADDQEMAAFAAIAIDDPWEWAEAVNTVNVA